MKLKYTVSLFVMGLLVLFACAQTGATRTSEDQAPQQEMTEQEPQQHMEVDFSQSCTECHTQMTPNVVAVWQESKHGQTNVKCYVCHGDGEVEFYPAGDDARCSGCHSGQEVNFAEAPANSCFDCHGGHSLRFHEN
jgi:hypothetical protein